MTTSSAPQGSPLQLAAAALEPDPVERVWFMRPKYVEGVELLRARQSPRLWKVWHETYTLCIIYRAGVGPIGSHWRYRRTAHLSSSGDVMLMQPGELHVTERLTLPRADFDVFMLEPSLVQKAAAEAGIATPVQLKVASCRDPVLYREVAELARCVDGADALLQQQRVTAVLSLIMNHCAERQAAAPPTMGRVQVDRACEYIRAHYATSFGLDELAQACGVSKSSLCHSLPRALGVTPRELRSIMRASRAKDLLARGVTPNEVAADTGFADQAQLTRHLKQWWGVTPARYARMVGQRALDSF